MKGQLTTLFEIVACNDIKGDRWRVEERGTCLMDSVKAAIIYLNNHLIDSITSSRFISL